MDHLMHDINELEARVTALDEQIAQTTNDADVRSLTDQRNMYANRLNEMREELSRLQANQQIAEEVASSDKPYMIYVSGQTINLRDYIKDEKFYQVVAIALSQRDHEIATIQASTIANIEKLFDREREQHRAQLAAQQEAADKRYSELDQQWHDLFETNADLERKLQAAANEADQWRIKYEELKLQQNRPTVPTNTDNEALKEAIRQAQEAKPRIYNKRPGNNRISFYFANLLETDEEIEIPWMNIGQYVEASDDEIARFREERAAAAEAPSIDPADYTIDTTPVAVPSFQGDSAGFEPPELGTDTATTGTHVGDAPESFEEEVRRRLTDLEAAVFGAGWAEKGAA